MGPSFPVTKGPCLGIHTINHGWVPLACRAIPQVQYLSAEPRCSPLPFREYQKARQTEKYHYRQSPQLGSLCCLGEEDTKLTGLQQHVVAHADFTFVGSVV